jgi:hypothetical protein
MRFCKSSRAWGSPIDWGFFDGTNASIFDSTPMAKSTRSGLKSAPSNMMPRGMASTRDSSHESAQRWPLPPAWKPPPPLPKPPDPQPPKPWESHSAARAEAQETPEGRSRQGGSGDRRARRLRRGDALRAGMPPLGKPGCAGTAPPQNDEPERYVTNETMLRPLQGEFQLATSTARLESRMLATLVLRKVHIDRRSAPAARFSGRTTIASMRKSLRRRSARGCSP